MRIQRIYANKHQASVAVAGQMVVATVVNCPAHGNLIPHLPEGKDRVGWFANTAPMGPIAYELLDAAAKVADMVSTVEDRPIDEYFSLFTLREFFETDGDEDGLSLNEMRQRMHCIGWALEILLKHRRFWALASDHLLATGVITESDARTYLKSSSEVEPEVPAAPTATASASGLSVFT